VEYFQRAVYQKYLDVSRLFLYYGARYLGGYFPGDNGAEIRNVMGALAVFGAPPERFWPYDETLVDEVPPHPCFAFGQSFQALKYYRLDPAGARSKKLLDDIRLHLSNHIPVICGFTCYTSMIMPVNEGDIPFPAPTEQVAGGHAVVIAGYDNDKVIVNPFDKSKTTGALLIRNSWGTEWGLEGYGWLPYDYVLKRLAADFWVLLQNEWLDIDPFM
jgi:C1A family cysteine protease